MGWILWVNLAYHGFGPDWIEKNFKISIRVNFESNSAENLVHPDWTYGESS